MTYISQKPVVKEFNNDGQAQLRRHDRYLVERDEKDGWKLVDPEDRYVSMDELGSSFGLWKDQEITKGRFWRREVVRPLDGKIDEDEVLPMGEVLRTQHDAFVDHPYPNRVYRRYDRLLANSTELELSKSGGNLKTHWSTQARHITQNDWGTVGNPYLA